MRMLLSSLLAAQLLFAAGCAEDPVAPRDPPSSGSEAPDVRPSISDGTHGGNDGLYFLPPLVEAPEYDGTFDPSRSPSVEIRTLTDTGCEPVVATFTRETGPGSETVRVDTAAEHYVVNWHTDQFELTERQVYRIRVLLEGREAGHADVVTVTSGKELKNAETGEEIALKDGRTLPIKFRIEEELVLADPAVMFPPDSFPTAIYGDSSNIVERPVCSGTPFMRSIVTVTFVEGTTPQQRQDAVDHVNGVVVGGVPLAERGIYLIKVEDDETGSGVCAAEAALQQLPTVERAAPDDIASVDYRRPEDGENWQEWQLESSAADGENWALEAIDAPLAWGCETGSATLPIMTVDDEIHVDGITDLEANRREQRYANDGGHVERAFTAS